MPSIHTKVMKRLPETSRRNGGLTHAQRAIFAFHQEMESKSTALPSRSLVSLAETENMALAPPKSPHSASEGRETLYRSDEGELRCAKCDEVEDECECSTARTDEDEGRVAGRNDVNDLGAGQPKWRGISTPMHSDRVGEALKVFRSNYTKKLRESVGTQNADQLVSKGF